jgi:hypothetical protein
VVAVTPPVRLHRDDLVALADLVADRLAARLAGSGSPLVPSAGKENAPASAVGAVSGAATGLPALLTAAEVAERFGVSAEWVRDHADELGVVRLGDGPRPRLRFDAETVAAALTSRAGRAESGEAIEPAGAASRPTRRPRGAGTELDFAPVRELQPRPLTTNAAGRRWNAPGPATRGSTAPRHEPTPASAGSAADARLIPRRLDLTEDR